MGKTKKKDSRRGASESGIHFWSEFLDCKRKFYLHHGLKLRPAYQSYSLLFGAAFHDARAAFYRTGADQSHKVATDRGIKEGLDSLKMRRTEFETDELYTQAVQRMPVMFGRWADELGQRDRRDLRVIAVEQELSAKLPNGYRVTGRLDTLVEDGTGMVYILEAKTSSFSVELTVRNVEMGDQVTCYHWLVRKNYPKLRLAGTVPDVVYWNGRSDNPANIQCFRGDLITRSHKDLEDFELYAVDTLEDLSRRMRAVKEKKVPLMAAFGRQTNHCFSYHRKCEFWSICRTNVTHQSAAAAGFVRDAP